MGDSETELEFGYDEIAQKILDLEATSRSEGWDDSEAIDMVEWLNKKHGPFDLNANYGQRSHWWEE